MNFAYLASYRIVLVSGPQRAGTRIAARMCAHDTGHRYVDEEDYGTKDLDAWRKLIRNAKKAVVHSPAMARWVHEFGDYDDVMTIWMRRPQTEILKSQARIEWSGGKAESVERSKYADTPSFDPVLPTCSIKMRYWRDYQRPFIKHWREVAYRDLAGHPLWVPEEKRGNFTAQQWRVEE